MGFRSLLEIQKQCNPQKDYYEVILEDDMQERHVTKEESFHQMTLMYEAMKSANADYDKNLKSSSKLVGTEGHRLEEAIANGATLAGPFIGDVMVKSLKMAESNACMKRIVAAPTAGSCGVVPAVFLSLEEQFGFSKEEIIKALYVVAGIGQVIATRAFISGAEGGCQAEVGSASAMAAGGIVYLKGGDAESINNAVAIALGNLLGLVCDPVAGLVEVPCVKRNVIGSVNAITSADMVLAGLKSTIPPDEVIDAMKEVGENLPCSLRETSQGGLAATPTGVRISKELGHY